MAILGVSHIALGVSDMDAALAFYTKVVGLTVRTVFNQEIGADQGAALHGGRAIRRRQAWLAYGDDPHSAALALDQLYEPTPADCRAAIYDLGTHHFAFWVDDIVSVVSRAREGGYQVIMPHVARTEDYGETGKGWIASVFLKDPDGNLVQCDQRVNAEFDASWRRTGEVIKS